MRRMNWRLPSRIKGLSIAPALAVFAAAAVSAGAGVATGINGSLPSRAAADLQPVLSSLRFEQNQGQFGPEVLYVARGPGYAVYLTPEGATLALRNGGLARDRSGSGGRVGARRRSRASGTDATVTVRLDGGTKVTPRPLDELPGKTNYYVAKDSSRWRAGVPSYGRVLYPGVLPGVDMVYYGTASRDLEYDSGWLPASMPGSRRSRSPGWTQSPSNLRGRSSCYLRGAASSANPRLSPTRWTR